MRMATDSGHNCARCPRAWKPTGGGRTSPVYCRDEIKDASASPQLSQIEWHSVERILCWSSKIVTTKQTRVKHTYILTYLLTYLLT